MVLSQEPPSGFPDVDSFEHNEHPVSNIGKKI